MKDFEALPSRFARWTIVTQELTEGTRAEDRIGRVVDWTHGREEEDQWSVS